jgi:hypothetical protein
LMLENQSRITCIHSVYNIARILEKDFTLTLVQLKMKDLEVLSSEL